MIAQRRQGRRLVHGRNRAIEAKLLRLGCEPSRGEGLFKAAVLAQERGRTDGAGAGRTGYPIRGITSKRDEVGYQFGLDPVTLTNLGGTDASHFPSTDWLQDGRARGGELIGVAIAARHERRAAKFFLPGCGRRQEEQYVVEVAA